MLTIKQTEKCDLKNVRELWADGDVMKFVGFPDGLNESEEDMLEWLANIDENRPHVDHFSIYDGDDYCGEAFYGINRKTGRAALDIKLFAAFRGKGIGRAGLVHAMKAAFENGAECVYVDPNPNNERALKLYESVGMIKKDMPEDLVNPGFPGYIYYELTPDEFEKICDRSE